MQICESITGTVVSIQFCYISFMETAAAIAPLYVRIAEAVTDQMARGSLRPGDRAPSLRQISAQQRVSMSTALQAYLWLENRGYLEARPKSGFYVRDPFSSLIPEPQAGPEIVETAVPATKAILSDVFDAANDPECIGFGAGCASPELFPNRSLNLILRRIVNRDPMHSARYFFPPGAENLRRQIARRALDMQCRLSPRDVTITGGALESVYLSLRATTKPGDAIAVESPTYLGVLGCATAMGLELIEIPAHPQEGMDLNQLEHSIRKHRIKACVVMTNCHNPLGYILPDQYKRSLAELAARHNFAVIEDEVYADLPFHGPRPRPVKSFDRKGLVLLCSSFSKTLAPGFRVGWVAAGRFRAEVERLKFLSTVAAPSLPQMVIAEFLESGGYDRHLKRLRASFAGQVDIMRQAIAKYFPEGTRISRPAGGHLLWVEMPVSVNAVKLYKRALAEHITILPGRVFSNAPRYRNYIRINCGQNWSERHDKALLKLGRLAEKLISERS
jgi:DNA-binding transcriptional MocR family regulator